MDALDSGPDHAGPGRRARERTCIVTRVAQAPEAMIRFVRGPDGTVVPDLRGKLPGRGAWVSAKRETVATAVRKESVLPGVQGAVAGSRRSRGANR